MHFIHNALSVTWHVVHQSSDLLQVLEDERRLPGFERSCYNSNSHKPFKHGNQIHSAGLLSASKLLSRGRGLQGSCNQIEKSTLLKSDTYAHKMINSRKSNHSPDDRQDHVLLRAAES